MRRISSLWGRAHSASMTSTALKVVDGLWRPFADFSSTAVDPVGAADGAGEDNPAGFDGVAQPPAVGNTHRAEVRVYGGQWMPTATRWRWSWWVATATNPGWRLGWPSRVIQQRLLPALRRRLIRSLQ